MIANVLHCTIHQVCFQFVKDFDPVVVKMCLFVHMRIELVVKRDSNCSFDGLKDVKISQHQGSLHAEELHEHVPRE